MPLLLATRKCEHCRESVVTRGVETRNDDGNDVAIIIAPYPHREALVRSLSTFLSPHVCHDAGALEETVRAFRPSCVIAARVDCRGHETLSAIVELRRSHPAIPILGYFDFVVENWPQMRLYIKAGVDDLLFMRWNVAPSFVREVIGRSQSQRTRVDLATLVSPLVGPGLATFVAYCIEHASDHPTVEDASRELGVHRKTLAARAAAAGLPSPRRLVSWCRLLAAARLLDASGSTMDEVAKRFQFGSAAALRRMLHRYTGHGAGRHRGHLFGTLLSEFETSIRS